MAEHDPFENRQHDQDDSAGQGGYEPDRINVRAVLTFTTILVVVVVLTFLALAGVMAYFSQLDTERQDRQPPLYTDESDQYPGPRLQKSPDSDMQRLREQTDARLNSFGWINRESQVAHLPIEFAIEKILEKGLPARSETAGQVLQDVDSEDPPRDESSADRDQSDSEEVEPEKEDASP